MTTTKTTTYTTVGPVCGDCGHAHRTIAAARRCADRHHRAIVKYHGRGAYSDRTVVRIDGEPLTDAEVEELQHCVG